MWRVNGLFKLETNTYHFHHFILEKTNYWASLDLKSVKYLSPCNQPQSKGNQFAVLLISNLVRVKIKTGLTFKVQYHLVIL